MSTSQTADDDPVVELDDVTVRFPRRDEPVLRHVSLRLVPGEHVVVLGASGSGKSTVLQTITGVVPHTVTADVSGEATVAGTTTPETSVVERSRYLGVLAQDPSSAVCLPGVEQELALPLENHAADPATIGPRIDEALDAVGASHLRDRPTAALSGGESQRVALAAALVTEPEVLLLDEPTSMLDPAGVAAVRGALGEAVERYGPAVVLVEHRLDEWAGADGAAGLPARALVLNETGEVLADGPTDVVLSDHARDLHAAGCWLPLDTELRALTGAAGGLANPANTELLHSLANRREQPSGPKADVRTAAFGADGRSRRDEVDPREPLLSAHGLAVAREQPFRRRNEPAPPPLLTGIGLELHPDEVVAVLGANGVGKSTLLLTLAGLLGPCAGSVEGPRAGVVFQNAEHQFLANSVRAEIGHGLPADAAEEIVARQLERHRLTHLADQNPFRLSGGEKRRLSLAAMLAHDRPVLLADEPTLGLDRRDAIATAGTLRDVAESGGAVMLASHDLRTVAALVDRIVVLGNGGVLADGPAADVLRDDAVLAQAGLTLPPLVAWLLEHEPRSMRTVLRQLDEAVSAPHRERKPAPRADVQTSANGASIRSRREGGREDGREDGRPAPSGTAYGAVR
ncbi:ATP-binding cassette domain-containing protein [Georgenia halophila]|uniref:ATP-binding cassette domain-containing protein n=1 Tax=Georgenia halophila TaxID=620889 RepID=A0ABP8LHJ1_9MICO